MKLLAAILAAGSSNRLGHAKQLVLLHNQTLLAHAIAKARSVQPQHILLTLGAYQKDILATGIAADLSVQIVPDYQIGISASIRVAAQKASALQSTHLMLILLDHYRITPAHLQGLCALAAKYPKQIIASSFNGLRMPPAIFTADHFSYLAQLQGDQGASLLLRHSAEVIDCDMPDPGDLNTPEDLDDLRKFEITGR